VGAIASEGISVRRALFALLLVLAAGLDTNASFAGSSAVSQPVIITSLPPPPVFSLSRHGNGELFFDIDDAAPPSNDRAARPRRVRVYWDHSTSRADDDLEAERNLLSLYLDAVHPGIIDLVLFSGNATDVRIVEAPQETEQLADILRDLRYEGAASVHEISDLDLPPADACLYFSDGTISVDPSDAERIRCPLFAISSAEDANRGLLRVLARLAAGAYLDLSTMSADDAVARLTGTLPRVLSVASSDGREIDYALLPSGAGRFRIVGPVPKSGEIVVTLAGGAKRARSYSTKRVPIRQHDVAGVLWAVDRLHELCATDSLDSERIIALARRYSLESALPTN
jgi:hypothetical protein